MGPGQGDLRILLLGKTGAGKSASGNTILGRNAFKESTKLFEKKERDVDGKNIALFDTPGLFNTSLLKDQVKAEIERCVKMSAPHVFLLVIKLGVRFTEEERNSVQWFQENFGEEALFRTIILFTHTDLLKGKSLDVYIKESHYLLKIVNSCGGRYHSFNNEDRNNQQQVTKLMQKIITLQKLHEMKHYTPEMFKKTQTEKTEKDQLKMPNITQVLMVLIAMIVSILLYQHLKNDRLQIEQALTQKNKMLRENEQELESLERDLAQNEQVGLQLEIELQKNIKVEEVIKNDILLKKHESEENKQTYIKKQKTDEQLKKKIKGNEQEDLQLNKKLLENEQEECELHEKLLKNEQEEWQLNEQLQQKKQENFIVKDKLLQNKKDKWQFNKYLLQKKQEKQQLENEKQQLETKLQQYNNKAQ